MGETTPWAVSCFNCGQVFLTRAEYLAQMSNPDALWKCTICGEHACFDDDNYEACMESENV